VCRHQQRNPPPNTWRQGSVRTACGRVCASAHGATCADTKERANSVIVDRRATKRERERFKTNTGHPGFLGTPGIWPRLLSKHLINLLTPQPHFLFFQATCLGLPNVITEKSQIYFYKLTCRSPEGSARGQEPRAPPCYANDPREPMLTAAWNIK